MSDRNEELFRQRREKLSRLREAGVDPYPARSSRTHTNAEALALFEQQEAGAGRAEQEVAVCGRIKLVRAMGKKVSFIVIEDESARLQLYCRLDSLGEHDFELLRELDLGDFIEAHGPLFRTKTGEVTVHVRRLVVLAKALQPPPEKWKGVTDPELRYRRRYLDLMSSEEGRQLFRRRSQIVAAIRRFMDARGFMEVETAVLLTEAGGAATRPFTTFFNALDEQRVLRISLELHLKRLLVGGFEKVYEIGRIFRNEGIDTRHNPEFTMMESYEAYADYLDVAAMVESLVSEVALNVLGETRVPHGESVLDLTPPWRRISMRDALIEYAGFDFSQYRDESALRSWMAEHGVHADAKLSWGKLVDEVFSELVQPHLQQPVFILDYPIELSPLAKRRTDDPTLVERFEAFAGGYELCNAYSELNDPIDQRERFLTQLAQQARGDDETELVDEDFLAALEHGMPPAGGLGIGIDRLAMLLLDEPSIKEVILFPQLRTRASQREGSQPG
jgi:lysyl-tRNA synthetase class 2